MTDNLLTTQETEQSEHYHKGITIDDIVHCIEIEGLTQAQTAIKLGCGRSNITEHLQRHNITPGYLKNYKKYRADILALTQHKLLSAINTDDLTKASLSQKVVAYGVLYDKERLERGQSTENIAYADMVKVNDQIDKDLASMRKKLGIDTPENETDTPPCVRVEDDKAQDVEQP